MASAQQISGVRRRSPSRKVERRHVILASIGTDGDVYPFLGLGKALRDRGHRVTLSTHESFSRRAADAGLEFHALVSEKETQELLEQPDFWHPLKGPLVMARWGTRFLARQYKALAKLASRKSALLITHPGIIAGRILQEHSGLPLVSVVLQPWVIPSIHVPPVMMGGLTLPPWAPPIAGKVYFRMLDGLGGLLVGREVNRLRKSIGLRPVRRIFQWWFSPHLVLGMFPDWFGKPQSDWPSQIKLVGFPLDDGHGNASVSRETIGFRHDGPPPIAFTFGTGMLHAAEVFRECIEACRLLRRRGLLITKFRPQLPAELPTFVRHCEYAPFQDLFPLCATVVHHGGIGTVAKALAAGVPQLILPFAFDQLDNALRVKKLGAGGFLNANQRNPKTIAAVLRKLIAPETAEPVRALAERLKTRSGLECAADQIETFTTAL